MAHNRDLSFEEYKKKIEQEIEEDRNRIKQFDVTKKEFEELKASIHKTTMFASQTIQTLEKRHQEAQRKQQTPGSATVVSPKIK